MTINPQDLPDKIRLQRAEILDDAIENAMESCIGRDPEATMEEVMEAAITALIESGFTVYDKNGVKLEKLEEFARKHGLA